MYHKAKQGLIFFKEKFIRKICTMQFLNLVLCLKFEKSGKEGIGYRLTDPTVIDLTTIT